MLFWSILGQRKTSLFVFYEKGEQVQLFFWSIFFSNGLYQAIRNNIVAKKTTKLVFLFHKNTNKLVFLWPNMGQKSIKGLKLTTN